MNEVRTEHNDRADIFVTVPRPLVDLLEAEAANEKRSRNAQLEVILEARYRDRPVEVGAKPRRTRRAA